MGIVDYALPLYTRTMQRRAGTNAKNLVLCCMPLTEKGVGSAWGLPVIASGKERFSARSLSERLQPPFAPGADPFAEEKLSELEKLGIGTMGRYLGGEPVQPLRLFAEDFFSNSTRRAASAAELFCGALEFEKTHWIASGSAAELFHGHLEFLRMWGFSGGVHIAETSLAPLLADYLRFLQNETKEPCGIIVLVQKAFFETKLRAELPNAAASGDTAAGEIPVNLASGGIPIWAPEHSGLGIALYEDAAPALHARKARCDILITVNCADTDIKARLTLGISTEKPARQKPAPAKSTAGAKTNVPPGACLRRNLFPEKPGGNPEALPFPAIRKTEAGTAIDRGTDLTAERAAGAFCFREARDTERALSREAAAAMDLLPQWEAGRVEAVLGTVFAVNSKFSGLVPAGFKEEQAMFYAEGARQTWPPREPPPLRPECSFTALNESQLAFFLRWRNECRRGYVWLPPGSPYIETYLRLYVRELALCMGKESPFRHFRALVELFRACAEHYPETAEEIRAYCVDFIVVYSLGAEAFAALLDELFNMNRFSGSRREIAETEELLIDLAISFFFVEQSDCFEKSGAWPLIARLIPPKTLHRKENDASLPEKFCRTLSMLDSRLRSDWHRSFFTFFSPPLFRKAGITAFENIRLAGDSSYTVYRPDFSSHKPLRAILSALVLNPDANPLPEVKVRLHPLSLENELLETLREESDAVREMLKTEETAAAPEARAPRKALPSNGTPLAHPEYSPPDKTALAEFAASLTEQERQVLQTIARRRLARQPDDSDLHPVQIADTDIDSINAAFYERFGDLLIEADGGGYSISAEYTAILGEWE